MQDRHLSIQQLVRQIQAGLMKSTPHRHNILDPQFTHIGIGIAADKRNTVFVTQVFLSMEGAGRPGYAGARTTTDHRPGLQETHH